MGIDNMKTDKELCEMISGIAANPEKIVEGLTVGVFYQMKMHIVHCMDCRAKVEAVPDKPTIGFNVGEASEN